MKDLSYDQFLEEVVERGIAGAERDYATSPVKLVGAVQGFYDCKGQRAQDLPYILKRARERAREAFTRKDRNYWAVRAREAEVEWVCNVVGAYCVLRHDTACAAVLGDVPVTARGLLLAAHILEVNEPSVPEA